MATRSEPSGAAPFRPPVFRDCARAAWRMLGCAALLAAAGWVFMLDAQSAAEIHFAEGSHVETAQLVLLLLSLLAFTRCARQDTRRQALGALFSGMILTALIRELDWVMDDPVHGLWKAPAAAVLLMTLLAVWRNRVHLLPALAGLARQPAGGLLAGGGLTVMIFSRLFGIKANWVAMMGHGALMSSVKRAAEEGTELLGYVLIACGAWAFMLDLPPPPAPENRTTCREDT